MKIVKFIIGWAITLAVLAMLLALRFGPHGEIKSYGFLGEAHAAEIRMSPNYCGQLPCAISIVGEIKIGDGAKFHYLVPLFKRSDHGIVLLNSPGGSVLAGELIAFSIMEAGYATVVPENATCASICANIWLTGKVRFLASTAHIGFHSVSINGQRSERGNDYVKDYIYKGLEIYSGYKALSKEAKDALLSADPNSMLWMTPEIAKTLGIEWYPWPPQ
jgi:ATP-dependent protease ClpP protease subunit